uniref:TNF superfamily member 11 n=1 Tax=Latimeria chalumnae TaxID=7897 RepID=H3AHV3_LATCH
FMDPAKKSEPERRPTSHLTIKRSKYSYNSTLQLLTSWEDNLGLAHASNMTYKDGKLKIHQDGFYYVYTNICFRHHETSGRNDLTGKGIQLMLYMYHQKVTGSKPRYLMKGGSTKYWSSHTEHNFYCIYQGGIFKLKSGDEIFLKISYASLLDQSQEASYFGAFKLRDLE